MKIANRKSQAGARPAQPRARWRRGRSAILITAFSFLAIYSPAYLLTARVPLAIAILSPTTHEAPRFGRYEIEFDLSRRFKNPFDPDEIDVRIEIIAPDGARRTHPAFWDVPHVCALDHGREVVRRTGGGRWKVRFSPMALGRHRWTLTAKAAGEHASLSGDFLCTTGDGHGFLRVSAADRRCLEYSDGSFFCPIGHCTRSPIDDRWRASDPDSGSFAERYLAEGTFAYADWFRKMHESGENLCSVWMAPWWCGIEWTRTRPGFGGTGWYNQINAARVDHLIDMAEQHHVHMLLFTMNHGTLSSFIDGEWDDHPYNNRHSGGMIEFASDFFENEEARRRHRNLLRYLIARWSYSPAIAAWVLSTEIDWVEAYHGKRGVDYRADAHEIPSRRDLVVQWVRQTADYMKALDAHPHIVSTQVCEPDLGDDIWSVSETEIVLTNAYTHFASNVSWQGEHWSGSRGVADAMFAFGKNFEDQNKPVLVAEWGGTVDGNRPSQLEAELHTGLWSQMMTNVAGATGFWWWNAVDKDGLYAHFRAIARFNAAEDRRGKGYDSQRARVLVEFSPFSDDDGGLPSYAPHPRQSALVRFNNDSLRGYVYCREINAPRYARPAKDFDDPSFPESGPCDLELPGRLSRGRYHVDFWNTFTGEVFLTDEIVLAEGGSLLLPLPSHRVDVAVKMDRLED